MNVHAARAGAVPVDRAGLIAATVARFAVLPVLRPVPLPVASFVPARRAREEIVVTDRGRIVAVDRVEDGRVVTHAAENGPPNMCLTSARFTTSRFIRRM